MKPGWQIKTLGEVCKIRAGANQRAVEDSNGAYPIYESGGKIGFAKAFRCPAQTVLIGRKGTLNNPIFVQTPCWNIGTAFGLIPQGNLLSKVTIHNPLPQLFPNNSDTDYAIPYKQSQETISKKRPGDTASSQGTCRGATMSGEAGQRHCKGLGNIQRAEAAGGVTYFL
ncbi:MAG: restriction endonuclease subunit S [Victivallaceae bacterium]|nr:restriction endonuclease subunit S [Victivallaceae bacterium]